MGSISSSSSEQLSVNLILKSTFLSMQKGHVSICDQLTSAIYLLQVCLSHHHLFCKLLPIKTTGSIETKVDKDGP
jgi:hypothetical protein